ncbi:UNVERIFIED_CONTAM: hypothetical protein Scaly_0082400 [Sesamum calycinum]|uniref:GAG-pre-integrase domain-containing protein n=1 Tax=Sesamum calycinum TaxID=2727403 RepID=A0AAW2SV71_9LAMI
MIRLESSESCEEVRRKILGISWNENVLPMNEKELMEFDQWMIGLGQGLSMRPFFFFSSSLSEYLLPSHMYLEGNSATESDQQNPLNHIVRIQKHFFGTEMVKGSFVQSHGVKMLFLVEKLEDLKVELDNDTDPQVRTAVLVGEASTSKAKGKRARRWKRKKEKGKITTPLLAPRVLLLLPVERAKGKERLEVLSGRRQMMSACIAKQMGIGGGSVHNSSPTQVLERNRKLSKDEMILRLGDGEGHIFKDRIRKLVDSKSLEIDDLENLPTCESCLKGKMTKKPFVAQSALANGLLDLIHINVCRPLNTPARGGFSYSITFTDYHSWYDYVYLMRYKSEAFRRFKEYKLEVENKLAIKSKSFDRTEGYALETTSKLLNMVPSKMVPQMPYEVWHDKPASYKYLRVWGSPAYVKRLVGDKLDSRSIFLKKGIPMDNRRDEVLLEESSEPPQQDDTTSFDPSIPTDGVLVLRKSTKESRPPKRYRFMGLTSQLDNDLKTYGEAMSDIDSTSGLRS